VNYYWVGFDVAKRRSIGSAKVDDEGNEVLSRTGRGDGRGPRRSLLGDRPARRR
jgi:hypothetical protein